MDQGVARPAEIFGIHVFDKAKMKERLPENVFRQLMTAVNGEGKLDGRIADYVAAAMKEWALSVGATHYAHWFQPRTEVTAERHMAFLNLDSEGNPIQTFGGSELIRSEPDASSFPSGGMRDTFEARGYCTWDPSSPAFVVLSHKGGTLCIPSVFMAYDGTPLDMKTPLLKSIDAIQERALRLLKLFGNRTVRSVDVTIGAEQEYFLVDEEKARLRPDIELCRRTLIGAPSPKAQTVEAHYFGAIHPRVLAFMEDVERDMYRLGQVMSTRHNEVAPGQFEFAPVLAEANLGCDQNQMLMEVMRKMARRHHFQLLLHEKPFASVNGSGKHLNVSLRDSEGRNLLKPTNNSLRNVQFLSFIASFLMGVARHGGLLRACIASAGNSHRLGGNEAPPAVMSVFVGSLLDHVMSNIAKGMTDEISAKELLDTGLDRLPTISRDMSDRNRTSPIAFTGNKWEFRAVGAPQALSGPLTILLAIWAEGIERFSSALKARIDAGSEAADAALAVIRDAWKESAAVRFEGNGYDPAWIDEAKRRGLPVCKNTVEALDQYLLREHSELLTGLGIMTEREIEAYYEVRLEQYCETTETELGVLRMMMYDGVLPAVTKQIAREATTLASLPERARGSLDVWEENIDRLAKYKCDILKKVGELEGVVAAIHGTPVREKANILVEKGEKVMAELRALSDAVEPLIAAEFWPYPSYTDLYRIEDFKLQ
jgi:glutamine synthetase